MSIKFRLKKLEKIVIPVNTRRPITRMQFEERVTRLKLGLSKFGISKSDDEIRKLAAEYAMTCPNFGGFGFDPGVNRRG